MPNQDCTAEPSVVGVRLFRDHGQQLAVTAGLAVSRGDKVLLIDADLQDPPELLRDTMTAMDNRADVVYGQRLTRVGESTFKLVSASLFYRFLDALSRVPIPRDTGDFRLGLRLVCEVLAAVTPRPWIPRPSS